MSDEGVIYQELWELIVKWANTNDSQLNHQAIKMLALIGPANLSGIEAWERIKIIAHKYLNNLIPIIYQDTEYYLFQAILQFYPFLPEKEKNLGIQIINNFPDRDKHGYTKKFYSAIA